jgi:hypothetical protein
VTDTPAAGGLPQSALQPYANTRILLFSNAIPGVLDSERTGRFVFEGFLERLRGFSSKENARGWTPVISPTRATSPAGRCCP